MFANVSFSLLSYLSSSLQLFKYIVIVTILGIFGASHPPVAEQVCAAIRRLAVDSENRDLLGQAGGCEAVIKILQTFGQSSSPGVLPNGSAVAEQACVAIYRLSFESLENATRLGQAGACEGIVLVYIIDFIMLYPNMNCVQLWHQ